MNNKTKDAAELFNREINKRGMASGLCWARVMRNAGASFPPLAKTLNSHADTIADTGGIGAVTALDAVDALTVAGLALEFCAAIVAGLRSADFLIAALSRALSTTTDSLSQSDAEAVIIWAQDLANKYGDSAEHTAELIAALMPISGLDNAQT
jgi:hypothetical protein